MIYNEQQTFHKSDSHECPYCPCSVDKCDNLVLSFVVKEGILQRLYDTTEEENENWAIRVFECRDPIVSSVSNHQYSDRPFYREPACGYDLIVVPTPEHDLALSELSVDQYTVKGLILGGPGPTKETFLREEYLDYRLQNNVIATLDTSYSGDEGVREIIDKVNDQGIMAEFRSIVLFRAS